MTITIREAEEAAWSEDLILLKLKKRYDPREWVVLSQVRNKTGYDRKPERYADALALNCWKSRGMELHGFEFKSRRSDLLRELRDPNKAESGIYAYCDRWWLVVGHLGLIKPDELPVTWGLMAPKSGQLAIRVKAPKLEPKELDRRFVASVLRAAQWQTETESHYKKGFDAGKSEGIKDGIELGERRAQSTASFDLKRGLEALQREEEFKKAAGIGWGHYNAGQIGHIVAFLMGRNPSMVLQSAKRVLDNAAKVTANGSKDLEAAIKESKDLEKITRRIREGQPPEPSRRRKKGRSSGS